MKSRLVMIALASVLLAAEAYAADAGGNWGTGGPQSAASGGPGLGQKPENIGGGGFTGGLVNRGDGVWSLFQSAPAGTYTPGTGSSGKPGKKSDNYSTGFTGNNADKCGGGC